MRTWASALFVAVAVVSSSCGSEASEVAQSDSVAEVDSQTTSTTADTTVPTSVTTSTTSTTSTTTTPSSSSSSSTSTSTSTSTTVAPQNDSDDEAGIDAETTSTSTASTTTSTAAASQATTSAPAPTSTTTTSTTTTTSAAPQTDAPTFEAQIFEITGPIANKITSSWREGCPVGLGELRLIALNHWNYSGNVVGGELVVHEDYAPDIVEVFSRLFDAQFPIQQMQLVDNFSGDDDLSMAANNTSAFNCREIAARPGTWSNHAYGAAIDINPLVNPFVSASGVYPPEGASYADRSVQVQGGIYPGDVVTQAFAAISWGWGGDWINSKDWQHFSATGR